MARRRKPRWQGADEVLCPCGTVRKLSRNTFAYYCGECRKAYAVPEDVAGKRPKREEVKDEGQGDKILSDQEHAS